MAREFQPPELLTLPVPGTNATFPARVFSKINFEGDCWEWTAATTNGYGTIGKGSRGSGSIQAHRAVWLLLVGVIPSRLQLDHLCRNHGCCNPDHLEPVTGAENKRRGFSVAVLHAKRARCLHGHPLDGVTGARGGPRHRYCKTCARAKSSKRYVPKGSRQACKHGHEFTPESTYIDPKYGKRNCRICKITRQRDARAAVRSQSTEELAA
jgi:hypothetical protein